MATLYSKVNVKQIGRSGNWKSLGLPSLRDIEYDPPITKTRISNAYKRLRAGETVVNPFGETLFVDKRTLAQRDAPLFENINKESDPARDRSLAG